MKAELRCRIEGEDAAVIIREAADADLPEVLGLLRHLDAARGLGVEDARRLWRRMGEYPFYKLFVAKAGEELAGTYCLLIADNLGHGGAPFAVVENVVVHPEYRGRGLGKGMMEHAMDTARRHGCYKLMLSSNERRTGAHQFYEKLDFARHGISFQVELGGNP